MHKNSIFWVAKFNKFNKGCTLLVFHKSLSSLFTIRTHHSRGRKRIDHKRLPCFEKSLTKLTFNDRRNIRLEERWTLICGRTVKSERRDDSKCGRFHNLAYRSGCCWYQMSRWNSFDERSIYRPYEAPNPRTAFVFSKLWRVLSCIRQMRKHTHTHTIKINKQVEEWC